MNRLHATTLDSATGPASDLFTSIKRSIGMVPNTFLVVGSNSPLALGAALALDGTLHKGSLSNQEIEVIKLTVSEVASCDYCLGAHSAIGKKAGLSREEILAVRHGNASGNARFDALSTFVRGLAGTRGTVSAELVAAVKEAGYSDEQIVDTLLAITSITFTNLVNRVNDTTLDFPPAD